MNKGKMVLLEKEKEMCTRHVSKLFSVFFICCFLLTGMVVLTAPQPAQAVVPPLYVRAGVNGDCNSWANACDLQSALSAAVYGQEIWVAAGIYKPSVPAYADETDPRAVTFTIPNGVAVYGGFPATGTPVWTDRNWETNVTILSGDIDNNDTLDDGNAYHVAYIPDDATISTILDGFTITGGNADDTSNWCEGAGIFCDGTATFSHLIIDHNEADPSSCYGVGGGGIMLYGTAAAVLSDVAFSNNTVSGDDKGGGLYSYQPLTLTNVTFTNNQAGSGGGMTLDGESATLNNVTFTTNSATTDDGGGMQVIGQSWVVVSMQDVIFSGNTANYGGGMAWYQAGSATMTNVKFLDNVVTFSGGAIYQQYTGTDLHIYNALFSGNSASAGGGGIDTSTGSLEIVNSTFSHNTAGYSGAIDNNASMTVKNSILWDNEATYGSSSHPDIGSYGTATVSYSDYDPALSSGLTAGAGNINSDPLFADPDNGDFHLETASPAINAGDNSAMPADITTDLDGNARIVGSAVDMGPYELANIMYVKVGATGGCTTWADACDLQNALGIAGSGDEIWVAAGTYKPSVRININNPDPRTVSFMIPNGVAVYGGFAGTETLLSQRDWENNVTILSGDIDNNDSQQPIITNLSTVTGNGGNAYHVVYIPSGATSSTILDGFTITGGNADDPFSYHVNGGGMYNDGSSPTLTNLIFSGNSAHSGGGMFNDGTNGGNSNPTLTNVTFSNDAATTAGGGMVNDGEGQQQNGNSSPTLTNVTFSNNSAPSGGGMYNAGYSGNSSPKLTNVTFSGNSATTPGFVGGGGGMYNDGTSGTSSPSLTNVTFSGNSVNNNVINGGGGAMYNTGSSGGSSSPTLMNVTFSGNSAPSNHGSGMYNWASSPTLTNCIFWDSSSPEIYNSSASPTISYSIIRYGCPLGSSNCSSSNPLLGTLGDWGGYTQTVPLSDGSPAIDAGTSYGAPLTDQRGVTRPQGNGFDIGAYEYEPATVDQTITVDQAAPSSAAYNSTFDVEAHASSGLGVAVTTDGSCSGSGTSTGNPGSPVTITMTSGSGTCTVYYNQAGNSDYNEAPQVTNTTSATKADATIVVTPYNGPYTGTPHGVTGSSATGVLAEDLSSLLHVDSTTYTDVPGGSVNWTFDGNTNYNSDSGSVDVVITAVPLTCTADNQTVQYSDPIEKFTATCDGFVGTDTDSLLTGTLSCDPEGNVMLAPGTYTGGVNNCSGLAAGANYTIQYAAGDLTVTQEDAKVTDYSGPSAVLSQSGSDSFTIAVDVQEAYSALSGEPNGCTTNDCPGAIGNATVNIQLVPVGPGSPVNGDCTPGAVDTSNGTGYNAFLPVTCSFDDVPVNTYEVDVNIGGYYTTDSYENVLTVYDPSLGFTTGGGWFYWPGTAHDNYHGDKTNFGYTMEYNKKKTNVQGSLLMIRHLADGTTYRIKSNALGELALGDEPDVPMGWASFSGKATYTAPGEDAVGNNTFYVYVEDRNQPGTGTDRFWIQVTDGSGSLLDPVSLSDQLTDAQTDAEPIDDGNIVVPHTCTGSECVGSTSGGGTSSGSTSHGHKK